MSPTKTTRKSATARATKATGFTADERAAMQERAREVKAAARRGARLWFERRHHLVQGQVPRLRYTGRRRAPPPRT